MAIVLGLNATTLRSLTGVMGNPEGTPTGGITDPLTWRIVTNIRDEVLNMDTALADITTRKANGWRLQVGTLSEGTVDCQVMYDNQDEDFNAFQDAFFDKTRILMAFFDVDPQSLASLEKSEGLVGGFAVTTFTINRQLEEAMTVDVTFTAREDDVGNGPQWIELTGV